MNKSDYVKSLKNVKLVVGNGFDLHCGLHTSYKDYFIYNWKKMQYIHSLYDEYASKEKKLDFSNQFVMSLNVWDLFFALTITRWHFYYCGLWKNIEGIMLNSFLYRMNDNKSIDVRPCVYWDDIEEYISIGAIPTTHIERFIVDFIRNRMESNNFYAPKFYEYLLSELKSFERNFGLFINSQLYYSNSFGVKEVNKLYLDKAKETISELCDIKTISSIESFNYGYFYDNQLDQKLVHINGSFENPIFGIDSVFSPDEAKYIFTKSSRRIERDTFSDQLENKNKFDHVVIYGHSLNDADYSYFFPLFDELNLLDFTATSKIIYAYSVYDKNSEIDIKSNIRKAISNLLFKYAEEKLISNPKRFVDSISTQNRLIIYEIPDISVKYSLCKNRFSVEWEDTIKEYEKNYPEDDFDVDTILDLKGKR